MRTLVLILALAGLASSASAQSRPSTLSMTCSQAAGLVAARGAVVLGTGRHTFDRFVRSGSYCVLAEYPEPAWVPTRDTPQCHIGYRCAKSPPLFWDR